MKKFLVAIKIENRIFLQPFEGTKAAAKNWGLHIAEKSNDRKFLGVQEVKEWPKEVEVHGHKISSAAIHHAPKFGSREWQEQQMLKIREKLPRGEWLNEADEAFLETVHGPEHYRKAVLPALKQIYFETAQDMAHKIARRTNRLLNPLDPREETKYITEYQSVNIWKNPVNGMYFATGYGAADTLEGMKSLIRGKESFGLESLTSEDLDRLYHDPRTPAARKAAIRTRITVLNRLYKPRKNPLDPQEETKYITEYQSVNIWKNPINGMYFATGYGAADTLEGMKLLIRKALKLQPLKNPLTAGGKYARYTHERLLPPGEFDPRSFRLKKISPTEKITIGCPKGEWNQSARRCRVGTRAQNILRLKKI